MRLAFRPLGGFVLSLFLVAVAIEGASALPFPKFGARRAEPSAAQTTNVLERRTAPPTEGQGLSPDPSVRFGVLENGMRYALMRNANPPGQTSLRLRIATGSLMERQDEAGLAHFLEHMAFNGSDKVPEGEMVKILERHGLAFGPDTNAFTSFEQTVYQLDLPKSDKDSLDAGLMLMRETAGSLTLDPGAIDRERGVVLAEERTRNTPGLRVARGLYGFLYPGQLLPTRFPIGDVAVIRDAPAERIRAFYRRYYRPDRAFLAVVGDFDPGAMEAEIRSRFSTWKATGDDGAQPDLGLPRPRSAEVSLLVEPGGPSSVQIAWTRAPDRRPDSVALRQEKLLRQLGYAVLNRRLGALARAPEPPFIGAAGFGFTQIQTADVSQVIATTRPGQWRPALEALEQEVRKLKLLGVSQAELDREIEETRAALQTVAASQDTRRSPSLAMGLVGSVNDQQVFTTPRADLAAFEQAIRGLSAKAVSSAILAELTGSGPLVFIASPTPIEGGEAAVKAALDASAAKPVKADAAVAAKVWPYADFGPAGAVADRKDILDLDVTFVRLSNGVRLTLKPTHFRDDEILISARFGSGLAGMAGDHGSEAQFAIGVLPESGLGRMTAEEMERTLASRVYGAGFSVGEDSFALSGSTRPEDLELQMQVIAAYLSDPAWRPEPLERWRGFAAARREELEATPGGVAGRDLASLLHAGDRRWAYPSREEIASAKMSGLRTFLEPVLRGGPLDIVIVGDFDVDATVEKAAAIFGALPARAEPNVVQGSVRFPDGSAERRVLTHRGRPDQALGLIAWPTTDFPSNPQLARETRMLEQVIRLRLLDELREKQGATYSPGTGMETSWAFPGYGYLSASIEAPPEKLDGFFVSVAQIVADLKANPPSADEMERARKPRIEALQRSKDSSNEYWLAALAGAQADPKRLDAIRTAISGLERVTPQQVQAAANRWLVDAKAYRVVITPEARPGV